MLLDKVFKMRRNGFLQTELAEALMGEQATVKRRVDRRLLLGGSRRLLPREHRRFCRLERGGGCYHAWLQLLIVNLVVVVFLP